MKTQRNRFHVVGWFGSTLVASAALAQPISVQFDVPVLDRWNYSFNPTPGVRISASTFSSIGFSILDNRDGEFLIGFDTAGVVPTGQGPSSYIITNAIATVTTRTGDVIQYDPTSDSFNTYLDPTDPAFTMDADAGRPIEMFGVAYRNGFTAETFLEDTEFQEAPPGDWHSTRNAFPTDFKNQSPRDVANNVDDLFDPTPFAVGLNDTLAPGEVVPANTTFTFDLDLTNPDVVAYLQSALDDGRIRLQITSLHDASEMGGGPQTWPDYYTKENKFTIPFGFGATLSMTVQINPGNPADLNGDGVVDGADLATLLTQWGTNGPADLNGDGTVDGADLATLLTNWGPV